VEWWQGIWNRLTWKHVELLSAGASLGAAAVMLWQHFDSMSGWPLPIILVCVIFFIGIGLVLFESAME